MAGHAVALKITEQRFTIEGETPFPGIAVEMTCTFHDDSLGISENQGLDVRFPPDATAVQIENAIEDEILARRDQYYPSMTLARGDMIYLDIKRGA